MVTLASALIAIVSLAFSAQAQAAPPTTTSTSVSHATTTAITLEALIDPQGKATKYHFEYGLADCASNPCTAIPVPDGTIPKEVEGSGDLSQGSIKVTGLVTTAGAFAAGQTISGPGIVAGTKITSVTATSLLLSATPTETKAGAALTATGPQPVSAVLEGLSPRTTYHFRAIAIHRNEAGGEVTSPDRTFATYGEPQGFGPCPNDALRKENPAADRIDSPSSKLPDCRAYEQASPVNKGGGDVSGTVPFVRAATTGGAVSFLGLSGIPGGVGSQDFPPFLAARSGEDWASDGLLPPASFGQKAKVIGWSPDFSQVYSQATMLGKPQIINFLVASPGAAPETIAPYTPEEPKFAGASEDGSEVLFELKAAIAGVPGALAGKSNLYLWDRASDTLSLAGVMNDGAAPPKGAFAGPYDWARGTTPERLATGGAAKSYYTQDQRAISTDGTAVFFTAAGSGQLYQRLNPTAPQSATDGQGNCTEPAKACTVNISASVRTKPDPAGTRPAAFLGASADGTKALFTSTQMLTDEANTGPEQEAAAISRSDLEGKSVKPDLVPTHAAGVAVDSEHIYWVDLDSGAIARSKLDGTGVDHEFITATSDPKGLAVANGYIYWTNGACNPRKCEEEGKGEDGTIGRAKLDGDNPATEVDQGFIEAVRNPWAVAVNTEHIYWTSSALVSSPNPSEPGKANSYISRAKLNGEEADNEFLEVFGEGKRLPGIAIDGARVYWMKTDPSDQSAISRADLDGTNYIITFIFVAHDQGDAQETHGRGIAVQGNHIYWAAEGTSWIGRAQLNGDEPAGEKELEFITGAAHPNGLAADATNLYWSSNGESTPNPGNDLYQYDITKPADERLSVLAPDHGDSNGIEARGVLGTSSDASYVYFTANGVPDGLLGSPNDRGESATPGNCPAVYVSSTPGTCNLYLAHAGTIEFITRLSAPADILDWAPSPALFAGHSPRTAWVTPDGHTLLFASHRQLTAYPNEGAEELYIYRAGSGQLHCVTCNPTGERPSGVGVRFFGSINTSTIAPAPPASTLTHNLSADGNRVFFETTEALVSTDTNGEAGCPAVGSDIQRIAMRACADTYEWEASGAGSCSETASAFSEQNSGCLYLISTGKGTEPQLIADASADGSEVFFFSRSRLVGQDEDSLMDVYGARVDGGLAIQNQPPLPPHCEGEGCKPEGATPPQVQSPSALIGPENPQVKRPRCKKPKRLVKGRCRGAKHRKTAKNDKRRRGQPHARGSTR